MSIIEVLILSLVEGISEFLPISSTGHLILASDFLKIPQTDFVTSFQIIIQLGAILAIVMLYWKTLTTSLEAWKRILLAFIPTAIVGFTLYPFIKEVLLGNPLITVIALIIGGIILIILELLYKEKAHHADAIESLTYKQTVMIGIFQSLSIIPGVSRAGATIMGGLFMGAKRRTAVEFSFLLALPTMMGATGLDLLESNLAFSQQQVFLILVGFTASFIVAFITVKFFVRFVTTHTFIPFGIYRIALGVIYWLILLR